MSCKGEGKSAKVMRKIIFIISAAVFTAAVTAGILTAGDISRSDAHVKELKTGKRILELYGKNPDMRGWIEAEGTDISYPVMNSDYYLDRNFDREYESSGTPFLAEDNADTAENILIYGHNMTWYGTMFHQLERFSEKEFFTEGNRVTLWCICGGGTYVEKRTYSVFMTVQTSVDEWNYWKYALAGKADIPVYLQEAEKRSIREVPHMRGDKIITLSTCSHHVKGNNGRLLVIGELEKSVIAERKTDDHKIR